MNYKINIMVGKYIDYFNKDPKSGINVGWAILLRENFTDKLKLWCENNCKNKWVCEDGDKIYLISFSFKNKKDAILFKLIWG